MTLSPQQRTHIEAALPTIRRRTFALDLEGQTVWVKRPRKGPGYIMYGLQAGLGSLLQVPTLQPPRVSRHAAGLRGEARRLKHLAQKGWAVPRVLGLDDDWLALTDNGDSLSLELSEMPADQRLDLMRSALCFLQMLHAQGGWHGAAQVRNFTKRDDGFGLIDFEDDLEPSMPLVARQARDLLLFIMSATRHLNEDIQAVQTLIADAHSRADPAVDTKFGGVITKLVSARSVLGPIARMSGPDGRSLDLIARACEAWRPASVPRIKFAGEAPHTREQR